MKRKTDKPYLAWIHTLGCLVCKAHGREYEERVTA
jgi:hypothetical protein